ncbi:adenosylcobinamide-GDP ribazoletransferase [Comamonas faecalis]|uniref:Adenosylcobinamide-GDP ribazoletransferase n=1 Tax=Comamonas faecalis TaxID=1387849 RepID=A0ABP7RBU0_9BURK
MIQALRHYLLAVQFFTRLPVTGRLAAWVGYSPALLNAASAHFPGVGWPVAAVACAVYAPLWWALGSGGFAPLAAAALATATTLLATGGFHEDGLADTADGLGGGYTRERVLEIMKDSRIGAFGAMALVLALLTKLALLAQLGSTSLAPALLALLGAHVLSRWWPLTVMRCLPYAGDGASSKAKPLASHTSAAAVAAGALWCVPALLWLGAALGWAALASAVVVSGLAAQWMHWRLAQRLQGFTGDGLGAVQQLGELGFYLGLALALAQR